MAVACDTRIAAALPPVGDVAEAEPQVDKRTLGHAYNFGRHIGHDILDYENNWEYFGQNKY